MSRSNGSSSWLSPQGAQRRDEILRLARTEARSRRRRREIFTKVTANIVFVVISIITAMVARMQMTGVQAPGVLVNAANPAPPPSPLVRIDYIQTDPSILDRLSIDNDPPRWQSINDDELIRAFAEAGQQVGIIRFDGKTELMTR